MKLMSAKKFLWWDKQRAREKTRFIHRTALIWSGWMIVVMNLLALYRGHFELIYLALSLLLYIPLGYFLGWYSWNNLEEKYAFTLENLDILIENETNRTNQRRIA